jgi:hypothetical protein
LPDIKEGRFDEVLCMLERERFDEDLRRLSLAAAYLRDLLPERRNRRRKIRRRCSTWTR